MNCKQSLREFSHCSIHAYEVRNSRPKGNSRRKPNIIIKGTNNVIKNGCATGRGKG